MTKRLAAAAIACGLSFVVAPAEPASADGVTERPAIVVGSETIPRGGHVTVRFSGCGPSRAVTISVRSDQNRVSTLVGLRTADSRGSIQATVGIPLTTTIGEASVALNCIDPRGSAVRGVVVVHIVTAALLPPTMPSLDPFAPSGGSATPSLLPYSPLTPTLLPQGQPPLARTGLPRNAHIAAMSAAILLGLGGLIALALRLLPAPNTDARRRRRHVDYGATRQ